MIRLSETDLVPLIWNYIDSREWHTEKIGQYLHCLIDIALLFGETAVAWRDANGEVWINFSKLAEIYEQTIKIVAPTFAETPTPETTETPTPETTETPETLMPPAPDDE